MHPACNASPVRQDHVLVRCAQVSRLDKHDEEVEFISQESFAIITKIEVECHGGARSHSLECFQMKKSAENRYPHSAELFRFCKEALNIKHNFEVKVIDQHVGSILGYDPADCSHWKKGKKNIKSLQTVNTIAAHLEIDARFVTDIISGKSDLEESLQEFRGYGPSALSGRFQDEVKREFFRNPARYGSGAAGEARSFEQVIDLAREASLRITRSLIERSDVRSLPVLLPELDAVLASYGVHVVSQAPAGSNTEENAARPAELVRDGDAFLVRHVAGEMKPHVRTLIAREIGRALLLQAGVPGMQAEGGAEKNENRGEPREGREPRTNASASTATASGDVDELTSARVNLFAGLLLIPGPLLQRATRVVNHSRDIVGQLSEMFWVGRTVMNSRLKDFLENGN